MIKVCHVTSAHNRYDGRIFLKQCVSLANNDYDVTLLCCDTLPDEKKNNVNIVSVNKKFNWRQTVLLLYNNVFNYTVYK